MPSAATTTQEGDWRSPAGVFAIGGAWGYDATIAKCPLLSYRQVTSRDLWVEDSESPQYNRNVILDHEPATPWEKKQQMKQSDPAHALKLFIGHIAPPAATPEAAGGDTRSAGHAISRSSGVSRRSISRPRATTSMTIFAPWASRDFARA